MNKAIRLVNKQTYIQTSKQTNKKTNTHSLGANFESNYSEDIRICMHILYVYIVPCRGKFRGGYQHPLNSLCKTELSSSVEFQVARGELLHQRLPSGAILCHNGGHGHHGQTAVVDFLKIQQRSNGAETRLKLELRETVYSLDIGIHIYI